MSRAERYDHKNDFEPPRTRLLDEQARMLTLCSRSSPGGSAAVAKVLGIDEKTLLRAIAGLDCRAGTIALIEARVHRLVGWVAGGAPEQE